MTPPTGSPWRRSPGRCATSITPVSPVPGRACAVGGSGLPRSPVPCSRTAQPPVCTPPGSGICPLGWLGTISSPGRCGWARPPTTPVIRTPIGGPGSGSGPSCSVPRCSPWGRPGPGRPGPSSGRSPSRCVCTPSPDGPPSWWSEPRARGSDRPTPTTSSYRSGIRSRCTTSTCTAVRPIRTKPRPCSPRRSSGTSPSLIRGRHPAVHHRARPAPRTVPVGPRSLPLRTGAASAARRGAGADGRAAQGARGLPAGVAAA